MQNVKICPCKDCAFAKYSGNRQTGCYANCIYKMRKNGFNILKAYDEEKEFFIIQGQCHYFRNKDKWTHTDNPHENVKAARKEMGLKYQAIIIFNGDLKDVEKTTISLMSQNVIPKRITVIQPFEDMQKGISTILDKQCKSIEWRVEKIVLPGYDSLYKRIELCLKYKPYPMFAIFNAGIQIPSETFSNIERLILDEYKYFAMIEPNSNGDGLIIPTSTWQFFKFQEDSSEPDILQRIYDNKDIKAKWQINKIVPSFPL